MDASLIDRLARLKGIGDAYHDYRGELRYFTLDTKRELLRAMGVPVDDPAGLDVEYNRLEGLFARRLVPPLAAARGARAGVDLNVTGRDFGSALVFTLIAEDGTRREGAVSTAELPELWRGDIDGAWYTRRRFELPFDLDPGYHRLEVRISGGAPCECLLVVAPPRCFEPEVICAGARLWGLAVQLYTLRSRGNWGMGDFADLEALIRWVAPQGAGFIGVNPLHALAPADPRRASPYSASSRQFLNVLYIAVPSVPELAQCAAAQRRLAEREVADRLERLRRVELVDYRGVAELKLEILEMLHREFCERHLGMAPVQHAAVGATAAGRAGAPDTGEVAGRPGGLADRGAGAAGHAGAITDRGARFLAFVEAGGEPLRSHALFDALDRHFRARGCESGWMSWPEDFRDVNGRNARHFAATHADEAHFFLYLQWLAHEQLSAAQGLARELGMAVGLYGDYAVGSNPAGSETWSDPSGYCLGAEIGAPPDPLALKGQGWGIPPQDPAVLRAQGLAGFARLIRANMRCYGALRLDHVMALFRLWWVPGGRSPTEGAYVHYPLHEILAVLALESVRAKCLVVGEDLGVVPDEMRQAMPEYGLYHYKVLLFEKIDGRFRRPDEFVVRALATATTHDMPTLRSYWEARDIELRRRLDLFPSAQIEGDVVRERDHDREAMLAALAEQNLRPEHPRTPLDPFTSELAHAMHLYLARTRTTLVAMQIEDLIGMTEPVNVPGTDREYPNWQRKITADLEELAPRQDLLRQFAEISAARRG